MRPRPRGRLAPGPAPLTGRWPLSGLGGLAGQRVDAWVQTVTFTEAAALVAAAELIVTILEQRAPGMSLNRMPPYGWSILVTSFAVLFAMPRVALASLMLAFDRLVGAHNFNPAEGGDPLLRHHLLRLPARAGVAAGQTEARRGGGDASPPPSPLHLPPASDPEAAAPLGWSAGLDLCKPLSAPHL